MNNIKNVAAFLIEACDRIGDDMQAPDPGTLAELAEKYKNDDAWKQLDWKNAQVLKQWSEKWKLE